VLVDRKAVPWVVGSGVVLAAATAWYYRDTAGRLTGPSGGSFVGLVLGFAGMLMIVVCMLLAVRKGMRSASRLGRSYTWMQAHVWLGLISYPIIWLHAGLRIGGPLTISLMVLFTLIWLTGIIGLYFQRAIPRRIVREVPGATVYDQIGQVTKSLRREADEVVRRAVARSAVAVPELAVVGGGAGGMGDAEGYGFGSAAMAEATGILKLFYDTRVAPLLEEKIPTGVARTLAGRRAQDEFAAVRNQLPPVLQQPVTDLEGIVRQRMQLERQRGLHRWLHTWLLIHVPLSYAMLILAIVHAVMALRYTSAPKLPW
jgi:hypothetical protein